MTSSAVQTVWFSVSSVSDKLSLFLSTLPFPLSFPLWATSHKCGLIIFQTATSPCVCVFWERLAYTDGCVCACVCECLCEPWSDKVQSVSCLFDTINRKGSPYTLSDYDSVMTLKFSVRALPRRPLLPLILKSGGWGWGGSECLSKCIPETSTPLQFTQPAQEGLASGRGVC